MSSSNAWGLLREGGGGGGDGHLFWIMLLVGVGLNSSVDPDKASSCWELVLGAWAGLEAGVGLQLTDLKLLVRGMQGMTKRVGLNNSGLLL